MVEVVNSIKRKIDNNELISEQEKLYIKEFGRLGSKIQTLILTTEHYIGYYTEYSRFKDALSRINSVVVDSLGGWGAD